eukprot:jgi/Botrbrau1/14698/Bobra.0108s0052.1
MKLDVNVLRYLTREELRTLQAVELGQKNHELVPIPLIDSIAGLKHGGTVRCLKSLLRSKLVHHDNSLYDSYRLTNLGYDFLAIKALVNRGCLASIGRQIGVGKESDVFEVMTPEGEVLALKLHRLGRTSFRAVKAKRDYLKHRTSFSWLYLSRLAALKEYSFMAALKQRGFPVPTAVAHNRHAVLMSMLDAVPLSQVRELQEPGKAYSSILGMVEGLAHVGLVHCDLNEFNLLVDAEENITLIDFPQMVSISHSNAQDLFERDLEGITRFFTKKLGYIPEADPCAPQLPKFQEAAGLEGPAGLDVELSASGFKTKHQRTLEQYAEGVSSADEDSDAASSSDECDADLEEYESQSLERTTDGGSTADLAFLHAGMDKGPASIDSDPGEARPSGAGDFDGDEGDGEVLAETGHTVVPGEPFSDADLDGEESIRSGAARDTSAGRSSLAGEGDIPPEKPAEAVGGGGPAVQDKQGLEEEEDIGRSDVGIGMRQREAGMSVQQRVVAEARRAALRQAAAQSARGAHKATSKKLRQQTAKSGQW